MFIARNAFPKAKLEPSHISVRIVRHDTVVTIDNQHAYPQPSPTFPPKFTPLPYTRPVTTADIVSSLRLTPSPAFEFEHFELAPKGWTPA